MRKPKPDYTVSMHGSIVLFQPMNAEAKKHLHSHVGDETQFWGSAVVVEPRYVDSLVDALSNDGFTVAA